MESRIDLVADLNDEDDEGLGWSTLSEARDPGKVRPGLMRLYSDASHGRMCARKTGLVAIARLLLHIMDG